MNPSLGFVYELQFRAIHEDFGDKEQNNQVLEVTKNDQMGQVIVPRL